MKTYAGIDLHSSNNYIGVINESDKRLYGKRLPNDIDLILGALEPFKSTLQGVVVESTYNWYWLIDGLEEKGYKLHLANPSAIKQYEGLKYTDDKWDAFWLAHLKRLGILPEGYIYPKKDRPGRDLLRRRMMFVRHRTSHLLSLQSMIDRNLGIRISSNKIKKLTGAETEQLFKSEYLRFTAIQHLDAINFFKTKVNNIENEILKVAKLRNDYKLLTTTPGIGKVLALTIMMEVGSIKRFLQVSNYSSYCRCVASKRLSNGKKKAENNSKNGNRYLSWAYVEAANFMRRFCPDAQRFYQRKEAKTNKIVATKALANKISKATYYIIRDQVPFDKNKLFK